MLRPQGGGSEGQKLSKVIFKDLVEMKKMLQSASKNIIPNPRYYFLKIAICLYLLIVLPKNSFYVPSWEKYQRKSPETWFIYSLGGFLQKWRTGIWKILIFANFTGKKQSWNGSHIGFLSYFDQ